MRSTIHLASAARLLAVRARHPARPQGGVAADPPRGPERAPDGGAGQAPAAQARRRAAAPRRDRPAPRQGKRGDQRRRSVARARPGAALGHLGATPSRPVRGGGGVAGTGGGHPPGSHRASGAPLPGRLRPGLAKRDRRLGRPAAEGDRAGARAPSPAPLSRRGRRGAARPSPRAPPRSRDSRARLDSSRSGTRPCWSTPGEPGSCRSATGRSSSTPRPRIRSTPSWSTARSPGPGSTSADGSGWSRSGASPRRRGASWAWRPSGLPRSIRERPSRKRSCPG